MVNKFREIIKSRNNLKYFIPINLKELKKIIIKNIINKQ